MKNIDPVHLELLKAYVSHLWQPATLINLLHTRTDLDQVDPSEIQEALRGIETLLNSQIDKLEERIELIEAKEANNE